MKLYLVQHGDALAKEVDPERPLNNQGRQDVQRLARFLADRGVHVSRVWHSGRIRAQQTAALLAARVALGGAAEAHAGLAPNDLPKSVVSTLADLDEDAMVVGHQPFMGRLVTRLVTSSDEGATVAYRPGSIVCLERHEDGGWAIAWMLRPELMS